MSMYFFSWDTFVFSYRNITPTLSMCIVMVYSTVTSVNNKFARGGVIFQHTSVIAKYSDSVIDNVTVV